MKIDEEFESMVGCLDFLWIELTSRCNLRCIHCYAESAPDPLTTDLLTGGDYRNLLDSAASLGCHKVQFIGGEPTLNPALPQLIKHARAVGFDFVEVFTNAVRLLPGLLKCFKENNVCVATSFYSSDDTLHDSITQKPGSFSATVKNIKRLVRARIPVRTGIIVMKQNENGSQETAAFLRSIGVEKIGFDRVRAFGRGAETSSHTHDSELSELCGSCWRGSICISPNGKVAPCIMSRRWSVGSIIETDLATVVHSEELKVIRRRIYDEIWLPGLARGGNRLNSSHEFHTAEKAACEPACFPNCVPGCNPQCSPNCSPCYPYGKCNPDLFGCNPHG